MQKIPFLKPRKMGALEWTVLVLIMTGIYLANHGWPG
jgi:hypothetical protein